VVLWYCALKNLGLSLYLSQLLVKSLSILVVSPEYTFLVAPALALTRHEGQVSMEKVCGVFNFEFRLHGETNVVSFAKTAVVQVIARFTPSGQQRVSTYLTFQCPRTWAAANVWSPQFVLIAKLTAEAFLASVDSGFLCAFIVQLSTNITM
jgi:hypothetical protein